MSGPGDGPERDREQPLIEHLVELRARLLRGLLLVFAVFIALSFTWLMGLMGYVRSGLRQHWHVYGVMRDTSPDAFTPTLGFATRVVSVTVLIFFALIGLVFWLASLAGKKSWVSNQERKAQLAARAAAVRAEAGEPV